MTRYAVPGILLGVALGVAVGVGVYTFAYARGWSYLTDDPAACANCHVMREQFDGWLRVLAPCRGHLQRGQHPDQAA
jgi:nitrate/TMAO reductase-like tetraheme cytochrome c subunit